MTTVPSARVSPKINDDDRPTDSKIKDDDQEHETTTSSSDSDGDDEANDADEDDDAIEVDDTLQDAQEILKRAHSTSSGSDSSEASLS